MDKKLLDRFSKGEFIIIWDEFREHEGDFVCLGEYITPEKINLMLTYGKGMITVACSNNVFDQFGLKLMVGANTSPHNTQMGVGFDVKDKATTGVSAPDRCEAIKLLCDEEATSDLMTFPGHTFPLLALDPEIRFGHTEAGVVLAEKVGKKPVVALCEILDEAGYKADRAYLEKLSAKYDIPMVDLEVLRQSL